MKLIKASFISAFILCSGCGALGPLTPKDGGSLPVKAYAQNEEQSAERLLRTSPQARPNREQEILSRSTVRSEDPFDLPPENNVSNIPDNLDPLPKDERSKDGLSDDLELKDGQSESGLSNESADPLS